MDKDRVQKYVVSRVVELLHKETLDSYRVRNNNVFTSLKETRDIIARYGEMKVKKFETVNYLASETLDLLQVDTCLRFPTYSRNLLMQEIKDFLKNGNKDIHVVQSQMDRVLFCLDKCIEENKDSYLLELLSKMDSLLADCLNWTEDVILDRVSYLDSILSALCVQFISEGFDKRFLFLELKPKGKRSFDEFRRFLFEIAKKKKRRFEVIWRLRIVEEDAKKLETIGFRTKADTSKIEEEFLKKYNKTFTPGKYAYFYQEELDALDRYSAARLSRERLTQRFDGLHLGVYSQRLIMPDSAIVLEKKTKGWYVHYCAERYFLDGLFAEDYSLSAEFIATLDTIYSSTAVDQTAKDRIKSAIRHLNYGDLDSEIEQRFINYWIALEFIFASPQTNESTFTRLKDSLVDVLAVSYVKRNMDYLKRKLVEDKIISEDFDLWHSEAELDQVADKDGLPLFWKYKLKKMKSRLFGHKDKLKKYYQTHVENLERHIVRIYNLRNELVHEGAIKRDVENLASNLRYYLVFLLDQMIDYFVNHSHNANNRKYRMDDFFNEYKSYRKLVDDSFDLDTLKQIPIKRALW